MNTSTPNVIRARSYSSFIKHLVFPFASTLEEGSEKYFGAAHPQVAESAGTIKAVVEAPRVTK